MKKDRKLFKILYDKITRARAVLITTHLNPDLDGLAAEWAIAEYLTHIRKSFKIVNQGNPDVTFKALLDEQKIFTSDTPKDITIADYDLVLVFDTNQIERTALSGFSIDTKSTFRACVDHHDGPSKDFDLIIQDVEKSSTSELVYDFLKLNKHPISLKTAEVLFAGICFDTGIFQYSKTTPTTFRAAANLCEQGVKPDKVIAILCQRKSETEQRLLGDILTNFVIDHDSKIAYAQIDKTQYEIAEKFGIDYGIFCNQLLAIDSIECSLLFKEVSDDFVKVNLRSKRTIDVAALARRIGSGGGHKHAAALRLNMNVTNAITHVLKELKADSAWLSQP